MELNWLARREAQQIIDELFQLARARGRELLCVRVVGIRSTRLMDRTLWRKCLNVVCALIDPSLFVLRSATSWVSGSWAPVSCNWQH